MKKLLLLAIIANFGFIASAETISEIQGTSITSKMENKEVKDVIGVVTLVKDSKGFFIQSIKSDKNSKTSEGIYVENKIKADVKAGELVKIDGVVKETYMSRIDKSQLTNTAIAASKIELLDLNKIYSIKPVVISGKETPRTVHNGDFNTLNTKTNAMDYYESLEGMLVRIPKPLITGFKEKYGDIWVVPNLGKYAETRSKNGGVVYNNYKYEQTQRITITTTPWKLTKNSKFIDGITPNPGDTFKGDIVGVLYYDNAEYRILPINDFPGIQDSKTAPEKNKFKYDSKKLNVVSYNIENFSHVDAPDRVVELARQVKEELQTPDILGLIEVGDDDGHKATTLVEATENVNAIVDEIKKQTGLEYGIMTVAPEHGKDGGWVDMHIRNVILYRKDRLNPVKFNQGDSKIDTQIMKENGKTYMSYNPGRIGNNDPVWKDVRKPVIAQLEFQGKNIFVIANHLKSKRADHKIYGSNQPVVRASEEIRNPEAIRINEFAKEILKNDPNATIISLGDMNDFEFSNTIKLMSKDILIDTISELPKSERSTYIYQGNAQTLDNILINKKYKGKVNVDVIRRNSEFTLSQGSFSDHDPMFIQFTIK